MNLPSIPHQRLDAAAQAASGMHTHAFTVGLAPMEGVTNFATRLYFQLTSAPQSMTTPFLRVTPTFPHKALPPHFAPELSDPELADSGMLPYRLLPQLMAADCDSFLRTQDLFDDLHARLPDVAPLFLELNAGCPSPTCVGKGAGSSLLRDPEHFRKTLARLSGALGPGRLALKMRTGFDHAHELSTLLDGLEGLPLARLTLHGRTRADAYRGKARWDLIHEAARRLAPVPVIASGDVVDAASMHALLETAPTIAGVIIGRGALRQPWIFETLRTGEATRLSIKTLGYALLVHALLHELHTTDHEALLTLCKRGLFKQALGTDAEVWEATSAYLWEALHKGRPHPCANDLFSGQAWSEAFTSVTLGRVKMHWNYLRSSLPPPYFEPTLLRHRSLDALLAGINALAQSHHTLADAARGEWTLKHQSEHDWLYAGERRGTPRTPHLESGSVSRSAALQ